MSIACRISPDRHFAPGSPLLHETEAQGAVA
jgi:hypothetical protein